MCVTQSAYRTRPPRDVTPVIHSRRWRCQLCPRAPHTTPALYNRVFIKNQLNPLENVRICRTLLIAGAGLQRHVHIPSRSVLARLSQTSFVGQNKQVKRGHSSKTGIWLFITKLMHLSIRTGSMGGRTTGDLSTETRLPRLRRPVHR